METGAPEIEPFTLEEEVAVPAAPFHCSPEANSLESTDAGTPTQNQPEPTRNLIEPGSAEESKSNMQEVRAHKHCGGKHSPGH